MVVSYFRLFIVLLSLGISIFIASSISEKRLKILCISVEVGFCIYSGMGLAFYEIERQYLFLLQYSLGAIGLAIVLRASQGNYKKYISTHHNMDDSVFDLNNGLLPKIIAVIYIMTFVFPFIYPSFDLLRIFRFSSFLGNYQALSSTYKLQLQNDGIYQLICSTLRTLALPWFYIYLYRIKDKPVKFIIIYLLPVYLYAMSNNYISRNQLAVFAVFLYFYLYTEKIVSQRALRIIAIVGIPAILVLFAELFYLRVGIRVTSYSAGDLIVDIVSQEINFVKNYTQAVALKGEVSTIMFFLYVMTCFVPMSIRSWFGIKEINMARILSNNLLNMRYGDRNYYLILPSVLGEGIMIFDEYFAFIYLMIFALFLVWFLKRVTRDDSMKFLSIYFLLDVFRQLRGGSQFIIASWTASIIPFVFICYLTRQIAIKNRGHRKQYKKKLHNR